MRLKTAGQSKRKPPNGWRKCHDSRMLSETNSFKRKGKKSGAACDG